MKNRNKRIKKLLTKKFLIKEYTKNNKCASKIAKKVNCNYKTILRRLRSYNIPLKSLSEIMKHRQAWNKGLTNIYSNKTLKLMSKTHKGVIPWNKGIPRSKLTKEKISKTRIKLKIAKGRNNPNFNNWSSFEPYSIEWTNALKEKIRYRDKHICQICGCSQSKNCRKLDVHHIDYDKENINLCNLISLCHKCHTKTNFNRGIYQEYFKILRSVIYV